MSQNDFSIADQGMPAARTDLNGALQALASTSKGPSAPTTPYAGQLWIDDDTPSATSWTLNFYDGVGWISLGVIDTTANTWAATTHVKTDVAPSFTVAINEAAYADVASATTCDIGAAASNNVRVTGTTTITSLGTAAAGITRRVRFAGALTLTYNAVSLILPTSANITTAADDCAIFTSLGSGNWICSNYSRKSGVAVGAGVSGVTAGNPVTLNPYATNANSSQAHGLGAVPNMLVGKLECIVADLGYSIGDIVAVPPPVLNTFASWWADATNIGIITHGTNLPTIFQKTGSTGSITASKWKIIITPYKFS